MIEGVGGGDVGIQKVAEIRICGKRVPALPLKIVGVLASIAYVAVIVSKSLDRYSLPPPTIQMTDLPAMPDRHAVSSRTPVPPAPPMCTGTVSIAVDNAYVLCQFS